MSVYKKNAGLLRVVYKSNLKTAPKKVSVIGKYYPFNDGLDAYQWFEVEGLPATPTEKEFLEGNPDRLSYYVPSDITDIIPPLGVLFPNCTVYVVGNTEQVVSGLPDADAVAIVPNTLKSSYLADPVYSTYQNLTFDSWILQNETTIPFVGNTTLTASFVRLFYENAGGQASTVGKIIVAPGYTDFETNVFDLIFALFVNCQEIEYVEPRLPAEYQEVEYIESTGTQYINTGIAFNAPTNINITFSITNFVTYMHVFGASYGRSIMVEFPSSRTEVHYYVTTSSVQVSVPETEQLTFEVNYEQGNSYIVVNNGIKNFVVDSNYYSLSANIYLCRPTPTENSANLRAKIYIFQISQSGLKVRNFVPCYRKSDGEIGLYDTINGVFYTNQGTGVFLKGEDNTTYLTTTITRPALATATIVGSGTLTAQKVDDTLTAYPEFASAERVIVPVGFTEYESGSIQAIQNAFPSLSRLVSCLEGGNIDVDFTNQDWQDAIARLTANNKTLDEALVQARTLTNISGSSVLIMPPINAGRKDNVYNNNSNIVAVCGLRMNMGLGNWVFNECSNLVILDLEVPSTTITAQAFARYDSRLKRLHLTFQNGLSATSIPNPLQIPANVHDLLLTGLTVGNVTLLGTAYSRDELVALFNSLGTVASGSSNTLTIGATNLAKLTAEDIAIATNKGWAVQ